MVVDNAQVEPRVKGRGLSWVQDARLWELRVVEQYAMEALELPPHLRGVTCARGGSGPALESWTRLMPSAADLHGHTGAIEALAPYGFEHLSQHASCARSRTHATRLHKK